MTLPTITDSTIAAAAGAALRRIRLGRVVQDLEQLGWADLAFVVERRAAGATKLQPASADSAAIPCGIRRGR